VLLWTRELTPRYDAQGIVALSAIMIDPEHVSASELGRLRTLVFAEHDGFWLRRAAPDSVGRLIRRLAK
jgi:hypothetical protein